MPRPTTSQRADVPDTASGLQRTVIRSVGSLVLGLGGPTRLLIAALVVLVLLYSPAGLGGVVLPDDTAKRYELLAIVGVMLLWWEIASRARHAEQRHDAQRATDARICDARVAALEEHVDEMKADMVNSRDLTSAILLMNDTLRRIAHVPEPWDAAGTSALHAHPDRSQDDSTTRVELPAQGRAQHEQDPRWAETTREAPCRAS